ncbi:MAG: AEC family transporter [Candidatus Omnitrophota bacterium]|jgi:hypothetical protein
MFLESFRITGSAVLQIIILGAIGYFLVKKKVLGDDGLDALSRLTLDITLPILIFYQLTKDFSFSLYPNWWIFPLISFAVTALGLFVGFLFSYFISGNQHKLQFISLTGFQNSGYLPLALFAALFPRELLGPMLIYLFLFLLGFNFVTFSVGVYMLTFLKDKRFDWLSLFNPPVAATILSLALVLLRLNTFIPDFVFKPLNLIGECTLPLAMLVVGGNIAQIHLSRIDKKAMCLLVLAKLIILPLLGILFLLKVKLAPLISILIFIQLAMPPAANLSVIIRHYKKDDLLISQGLFFGHIFSILTLPLLLSLYFMFNMLK